MPDLSDIALFLEVAKQSSYSKASDTLGIPTSTLSRRISNFEKRLGIRLLNRTSRHVTLTESGERYYARCYGLIEELNHAHECLIAEKEKPAGKLRITVPSEIAEFFVIPTIARYHQLYPEVSFELDLNTTVVDISLKNIDIAIRVCHLDDSSLVAIKLMDMKVCAYATPAYLQRHKQIQSPRDLSQHPLLHLNLENYSQEVIFKNNDNGSHYEIVNAFSLLAVNNMSVLLNATLNHLGVGLVTMSFAAPYVRTQQLVPILEPWFVDIVPCNALVTSRHMPAKTRIFIQLLRNILEESC